MRLKSQRLPRHGPEGCESKLGDVTGIVLSWEKQKSEAIYFSGDTVWYDGVAEIGRRIRVGTALVNPGAVQIDFYGRLTMTAEGAANLIKAFDVHTLVPLPFEGWAHYRESREQIQNILTRAGLGQRVHWPERGVGFVLEAQSRGTDSTLLQRLS